MNITCFPLEDANASPSISSRAVRISIFDKFGTDDCLLDCKQWAWMLSITERNYRNKSNQRSEKVQFFKNVVQEQRSKRQDNKKISNTKLMLRRKPFSIKDLEISAKKGCGCCAFFRDLLRSLLSTTRFLGGADAEELELEWIGYSFSLKVHNPRVTSSFSCHLFSPPCTSTLILKKLYFSYFTCSQPKALTFI